MAITEVELRSPTNATQRAQADVVHYSRLDRGLRALGIGLAGIGLGGLTILAPGVHLVTTWLLPVLGVAFGLAAASMTGWVRDVDGPCPSCRGPVRTKGPGPLWADEPTIRCPHCYAALRVSVPR